MERRLAAILAADVVGYSRLIREDEAGALATLKAHREQLLEPKIAERKGRIVKLMGDGLLVEFPSAVEAVQCAVEIQHIIGERDADAPDEKQITYRIGINIGDIVVEDDDIYGDGVNMAARLEGLADPSGICVARNVFDQVKDKLDLTIEDLGKHEVKNIAEPVTVYRVVLDDKAAALVTPVVQDATKPTRHRWVFAASAAVVLVAAVGGMLWWQPWAPDVEPASVEHMAFPLPDKPSIAVLPFDNLSGDPEQDYFADGITEDIITDLTRFRDLFVIARNSTFVYKGRAVDVRQVARELGVQYVLEGSLQTEDERLRITAQLVDATTGNHVWADRYDRPLHDLFAVQDDVTQKIAGTLTGFQGVIARTDRAVARRKPPQSFAAYEHYLLGIEHKHRLTKEDNKRARALFKKAIEIDPNFQRGYVALALTYQHDVDQGWTENLQETREKWLQSISEAISLDPLDSLAHSVLGWYYFNLNDFDRSFAELEESLTLNPNDADSIFQAAVLFPWLGKPEEGIELIERAMRLNPHFPFWYYHPVRAAAYFLGDYERAIDIMKTKSRLVRMDYVFLALSYAQLGIEDKTLAATGELLVREPDYSAERIITDVGSFAREADLNRFLDGHRKAGLPLCATEAQREIYPNMIRLEECEEQRVTR
jgi:adenylate cyclase